jgi:hypothetical protein
MSLVISVDAWSQSHGQRHFTLAFTATEDPDFFDVRR